jgi:hypothetical protein
MSTLACVWLVLILTVAAAAKAARAPSTVDGLATYGINAPGAQLVALGVLIAVEIGLAGALAAGLPWAPWAIAIMFGAFGVASLSALVAGRAGRPCACFGSASRLTRLTPVQAAALAAIAAALALGLLPDAPTGYARWLTVGLGLCLAATVILGFVVVALARELGVIRLSLRSQGALEILEEGPPLGAVQSWADALPWARSSAVGLAVFTSDGCPLCRRVAPAVRHVAADPMLAVGVFDEVADAETWRRAAVPGSPYAVALDAGGVALSKGTFNSLDQLESILGSARMRERGEMAFA